MIKKLKDNFQKGIGKIRLFAFYFSERLKIEMAVIRLLFRSDEMSKNRDELLKSIGQRVLDLKAQKEKDLLKDRQINEAIDAIAGIEKDLADLKEKMNELSKVSNS